MMEVVRVESFLIYVISFILAMDFLLVYDGLLIPLALALLITYFLSLEINSPIIVLSMFPFILLVLYFYKLNKFANKLRTSKEGYMDLRILHLFLDKIQPSEKVFKRLLGQYGYVLKNYHDGSYLIRFNLGAFGRNKFTCFSEEPLERGDRVALKELKNGKIFVRKSNPA